MTTLVRNEWAGQIKRDDTFVRSEWAGQIKRDDTFVRSEWARQVKHAQLLPVSYVFHTLAQSCAVC